MDVRGCDQQTLFARQREIGETRSPDSDTSSQPWLHFAPANP
jgi:hypothetical protein